MDVQIPYSILSKVSKEGDIWTVQGRYQGNNTDVMQIQGHRNNRRPYDAGSHTDDLQLRWIKSETNFKGRHYVGNI